MAWTFSFYCIILSSPYYVTLIHSFLAVNGVSKQRLSSAHQHPPAFHPIPIQPHHRSSTQAFSSEQQPFNDNLSHNTAVAIIPPDAAWDTLQQARHWVQDSTVSIWPPAIRLFHPFIVNNDDAIFAMAETIEQLQQHEFQVTLSEWSIIPHTEVLMKAFAADDVDVNEENEDYAEIQALIAREEAIGKVNKAIRDQKIRNHDKVRGRPPTRKQHNKSKPQQASKNNSNGDDVFNGACVIVLEPDAKSRQLLQDLRQSLLKVLPESFVDLYSCTSTMPHHDDLNPTTMESVMQSQPWRPVVPIAAVSTTAAAIPLARHLRASWEPIQFNVTDLHVISSSEHTAPFGCDALISFVGQEPIRLEDPVHQEMAYLVTDHGIPGGADALGQTNSSGLFAQETSNHVMVPPRDTIGTNDTNNDLSELEEEEEDLLSPELERWLYDDQDIEGDGSVIVLGRVQFFTESQRDYVGMPALSAFSSPYWSKANKRKRRRQARSSSRQGDV